MANDLLADFRAASNRFDHVLYNEQTQRFERAGKRHAIAMFFGAAGARSKNETTLAKIKEALGREINDRGRSCGSHETAERLFSGIDAGRRIKSDAVKSIIEDFHRSAMADAKELQCRKESAAAKMCEMIAENLSADPSLLADARAKGVLRAVAMRHLDAALSDMDMKSSISQLQAWCDGDAGWKDVGSVSGAFADFADFVVGVNTDARLQKAFTALLGRAASAESPRFAQMVNMEMQTAAVTHCRNRQDAGLSDWTGAEAGRIERLLADMDDASSDFRILENMDMLPVDQESYPVALAVCGKVKNTPELSKWLSRQPQDSRVTLAAAIADASGMFGDSDDPVLLRKLMGVGDGIARLYSNGELTIESAFRAMEGSSARLPDVLNMPDDSVGKASDEVRYFFRDRAIGEFCGLFPGGPDEEKKVVGTRLIVNLGCSPSVAHWIAGSCPNVDLARLSDGQLKMFTTLTGAELEVLDRIAGFETALGTAPDDLHAQIADLGSPLWRLAAYPELSADAAVYVKARDLLTAFDARVGELANGKGLYGIKESTKWVLERFVFQDLAMQTAKGASLPGVQTFANGLSSGNQFVKLVEGSGRRPHVTWSMIGLAPEFRSAVLSAMDAYGVYDNVYFTTRLIARKEKVADLCNEAIRTGAPLAKEAVFHVVMGKDTVFDPKVHGTRRGWDDIVDSETDWVLKRHGLSDVEDVAKYARKQLLVNDFLQKYSLSKESVMDIAFIGDDVDEITLRHSEYAANGKVALVVNGLEKGVNEAVHQFNIDYDRAVPGRFEMKFDLPSGVECFRKTSDDSASAQSLRMKDGVREAVVGICGASHPKQVENLFMVLSQAFEQDIYAPFIAFGFDPANQVSGVSRSFEITRNGRDGSISVHVTEMGVSAVKYDWSITLFADGTHKAADMKAWRNPDCDGARL